MQKWTNGLNQAQESAVLTTDGPLLIVAGAGAGKTKTLTHRIGYLIEGRGIPAEAILAITFTNKAAKEMRERVFRLLGKNPQSAAQFPWRKNPGVPYIGTFHSLGVYILRERGERIGIAKNFTILDRDDAMSLLKQAMKGLGIDPKQFEPNKMLSLISRAKSMRANHESMDRISQNKFLVDVLRRVYREYENKLSESKALDFDDLLVKTVHLLETDIETQQYYQQTWRYVHVDEYQDTNELQYQMVRLLAGKENNVCVVGDSDQNIYSWRGASIANILNFEEDFPGAKVVLLEQNYRSTETILKAANEVIRKNTMRKDKQLFTENNGGEKIALFEGYDENDEARNIGETIKSLIHANVPPGEIAILYRTNFQSRVLEEALLYRDIPYQVVGTRFFERKEVKDVIAYLRAALNPSSSLDVARIINTPVRGIGKVTVEKVLAGKRAELPAAAQKKVSDFFALLEKMRNSFADKKPSAIIRTIITDSGIGNFYATGDDDDRERLQNIQELVTLASRYDVFSGDEGLEQFASDIALQSDQDQLGEGGEAVRLMTVHAAKGLEFAHVFITGLEQDLFPSKRSQDEGRDISEREEERRLFYVALTRAAKKVHLSYASFRTIFGSRMVNMPSEFLDDIPDELIEATERPKTNLLGDVGENFIYI